MDNNDDNKKANSTEKCAIKRKLKFQDYKNCLEATQFDSKVKYLEKNKTDIDSVRKIIKKS